MEEGVYDRKDDKNEKSDEEKEAECPYGTSPVDIEEVVSDRKHDKNKKMTREKKHNSHMTFPLLIWRKV